MVTTLLTRALVLDDAVGLFSNLLKAYAETFKNTSSDTFALAHQSDEQVLGANVVVVQSASFVNRKLDDFLRPWGETNLTGGGAFTAADYEFDRGSDFN
jgi:hypothetical protein